MVKVNLLAVSVGNTRSRIGAFVEGELVECATLENRDDSELTSAVEHAFNPLRSHDDAVVLMSSVNPVAGQRMHERIQRCLDRPIQQVEQDLVIPIGRQLDPESLIGEDRLLNAAAAFDVLKQACVVVDAGTAITVDLIDGAGTFHGGAIIPGAQLMLDALHQRTGMLPEVEFHRPEETIGHNTLQAMRTGVYHAATGMLRELVEKCAEQVGAFPLVVATGGDADMLFRDHPLVDRVVQDLTLRGLAVTLRTALENANED